MNSRISTFAIAACTPLVAVSSAFVGQFLSVSSMLDMHGSSSFSPTTTPSRRRIKTTTTRRQAFMLDNVAMDISTFYGTQPYVAAFLTCGFKASAADLMAQTQQQELPSSSSSSSSSSPATEAHVVTATKTTMSSMSNLQQGLATDTTTSNDLFPSVDVSRNLGFLFYGGLYQGMAQNWMYTQCYPELFGSSSSWDTVAAQGGFEMPIAYIVKAAFTSRTSGHDDHDHLMPLSWETVQTSLKKYVDDCKVRNLLFKFWALWIPVNSLAFSVIPSHFRVAFVACVSFFWVMILSSTSADCRGNIQPQQRVKQYREPNSNDPSRPASSLSILHISLDE